jgi:hypothetical protein
MEELQKRERQSETTTTTITMKRKQSKPALSSRATMPRSLNLWRSDKGQNQADENKFSTDSASTLGLQQMQGYDSLPQEPMQWADDEDRKNSPVSTITFPASKEVKQSIRAKSPRKDGSRFNSLPARHKAQLQQPQRSRYSTIVSRPKENGKSISEWESSAGSSPEGKTTPLPPMSLGRRSMKSLQGIASSWVPSAVRSPYDSESELAIAKVQADKDKENEERRPIRLDQRRLQKAVSLAVEAAQASAQDEKAWKLKKKRLARQQQRLLEQGGSSAGVKRKSRLAALAWKGSDSDADPSKGTMTLQRKVSDGNSSDDDTRQVTKRPGSREESETDDDEDLDDEEGSLDDDFSVDLYISSLSYLLAALGPRDAENVGDKHREELKRKLEEALKNLETEDAEIETSLDREEVIQWRVERELHLLEQAYNQRRNASPGVSRAHQAAQASSQRSERQSVAGYLTSSAIDLGLSVGAGALAAAARGVAGLLPLLTPDEKEVPLKSVSNEEPSEIKPNEVTVYAAETKDPRKSSGDSHALLTQSQWNLTRTLAQSVASTMYSNLAAVADQRKQAPMVSREVALYDSEASLTTVQSQEDASDQLIIIAATLARNVKRSPLPSQIRALTKQVISLVAVLDERYSLSKRSADVALRKTGQALYYVRKNDLHVKALRAVWAIVEASVAAVEAYRDEEEWKGEVTLPARIEGLQVK